MRQRIIHYLRAGYAGLYLVSPEEQRVEAEFKAIAEELGFALHVWSATSGLLDVRSRSIRDCNDPMAVLLAVTELPDKAIVLLRDFHAFLAGDPNPILVRQLKEVLQEAKTKNKALVLVGCRLCLPPELERELTVIEFALPGKGELATVLHGVLDSAQQDGITLPTVEPEQQEALLGAASGLTTIEAENAFALSVVETKGLDPVIIAREKAQSVKKSGLLELTETHESLDSIGGLDVLKSWLMRRKHAFSQKARAYGLPTPKGLLITGIPGTGKSLTAKATAAVFGTPLLRLDAGRIFGGLVGQSESNIRSVIQTAEAIAPCVLWLDEIEKGLAGSKSSGATDGGTSARVFGSFISWMAEKTAPVFVVATANDVNQLADSPLLQFFCGISEVDRVKVPAKSALQRYATWWTEAEARELTCQLLQLGAQQPEKVCLPEPVDLERCWIDTTCIEANIHYPVDWVLLRDATRTLMKAVLLIRNQGLKQRMEAPEIFITRMNGLCIQMTHTAVKQDSQHHRKTTLRKMDKLVGTVAAHARRYRQLLDEDWSQTEWTRPQAEQVLQRIDQVLAQLPKARKQARERILSGKLTENKDKILSLYDEDVNVIVRKKAGAEVEFGNTLLLGENSQGLIVDWEFFKETAPADVRLLRLSVERMRTVYGPVLKELGADRGFDSAANQQILGELEIYNGVCPRSPQELKKRIRSWKFNRLQNRRSQTEGRVAILKNVFVGQPMRSKGFANRSLTVTWAVLTHNLWVMARMALKAAAAAKKQAA